MYTKKRATPATNGRGARLIIYHNLFYFELMEGDVRLSKDRDISRRNGL